MLAILIESDTLIIPVLVVIFKFFITLLMMYRVPVILFLIQSNDNTRVCSVYYLSCFTIEFNVCDAIGEEKSHLFVNFICF